MMNLLFLRAVYSKPSPSIDFSLLMVMPNLYMLFSLRSSAWAAENKVKNNIVVSSENTVI